MVKTRRGADTVGRRAPGTVTTLVHDARLGVPSFLVRLSNGDMITSTLTAILRVRGNKITLVAGDKRNDDEYQDYVNGTGHAVRFAIPGEPAFARDGKLLVPDHGNGAIRAIDLTTGAVTTFAGRGEPRDDEEDDDEQADAPFLYRPDAVLDLGDGSFAVSCYDHAIRVVSEEGVISRLVGQEGEKGYANGSGADARFSFPLSMALEREGTFLVVDSGNHCIRRVDPRTATVTSAAGMPRTFKFSRGTHREVILGDGNEPYAAVRFGDISGITAAADGTVFVSEDYCGVSAICPFTHTVIDVAGCNCLEEQAMQVMRDGTAETASFVCPSSLCLDEANRRLYVADADSIRVVTVSNSVDRRVFRRMPLMRVRKKLQSATHTMSDALLPGGVQEPLLRNVLRFLFVSCPDDPYSLVMRFLVV